MDTNEEPITYVTEWLRPDGDGEVAVQVCEECAAFVMRRDDHTAWHARLTGKGH